MQNLLEKLAIHLFSVDNVFISDTLVWLDISLSYLA